MVELIENFYDRTYVNFCDKKVFVYSSRYQLENEDFKPEVWSLETARNYLQWLENNQPEEKLRFEL